MALIDKLKAIADGFRASRGTEQEYSLDEMAVLAAEKGEAVPDGTNVTFGNVQQTNENVPVGKALYNDAVLPIIPADTLASYPYAWIRNNTESGYYDLFMYTGTFWHSGGIIYPQGGLKKWYRVEISTAESATEWTFYQDNSDYYGVSTTRPVLWSNHDIRNGSADATEIYFAGSELVTGGETTLVPVEREEAYSIKSEDLNALGAVSQFVAGKTALMTIGEMIYVLNKAKFIPQGNAESVLDSVGMFSSNAVGEG
jgi:hypothetical protein